MSPCLPHAPNYSDLDPQDRHGEWAGQCSPSSLSFFYLLIFYLKIFIFPLGASEPLPRPQAHAVWPRSQPSSSALSSGQISTYWHKRPRAQFGEYWGWKEAVMLWHRQSPVVCRQVGSDHTMKHEAQRGTELAMTSVYRSYHVLHAGPRGPQGVADKEPHKVMPTILRWSPMSTRSPCGCVWHVPCAKSSLGRNVESGFCSVVTQV